MNLDYYEMKGKANHLNMDWGGRKNEGRGIQGKDHHTNWGRPAMSNDDPSVEPP
jgi:hypothetical protein